MGCTFQHPPADHTISWIALASGKIVVPEPAEAGELVAFEPSNDAIDFHAETDTEFVLGSAASLLGAHESGVASSRQQRIAEIKVRLQKGGRL